MHPNRHPSTRPFLLLTLSALASASVAAASDRAQLRCCALDGVQGEARCGSVEVLEDPSAATPRPISLELVVLPARTARPEADALFVLQGGPGQAATDLAPFYAQLFDSVRARRDVVLVDQRGTGGSGGLDCPLFDATAPQATLDADPLPADRLRRCLIDLTDRADVTRYTTPLAMDDLDRVRAALGYERIDLYGTSYGTWAAQVYLRRHGDRVRAVVLSGVVPIDFDWLGSYHDSNELGLDRLLDRCVLDPACRAAYPDLRPTLRRAAERLARRPAAFTVEDPQGGSQRLRLPLAAFAFAVRSVLSAPSVAVYLPEALAQAAEAAPELLGRQALRARLGIDRALSWGMALTVFCTEMLPLFEAGPGLPHLAPLLADQRAEGIVEACRFWPRGDLPEGFHRPVRSPAPALLVSGQLDPSTPPELAERLLPSLPNGLHVVFPNASHSADNKGPCLGDLIARFIEAGSVDRLDTGCVDDNPLPDFALPER